MKYALATCITAILVVFTTAESVFEELKRRPELSKFYDLASQEETVQAVISDKPVTLFAPVNHAMEEAEKRLHDVKSLIASYHISQQVAEKSSFPANVGTFLPGATPLFLTSRASETSGVTEYFVNNARITDTIELHTKDHSKQIMYIIDEVLEPYVSSSGSTPNALDFLLNPTLYNIKDSLTSFSYRVLGEKLGDEFQQAGNHTFFIPIEIGEAENINKIDSMVIKGHVIPNQVLFTRVMGRDTFKSDSYNDQIKVEISLTNSSVNEKRHVLKVRSNTLQSDSHHKKGVKSSRIVRANIPVRNGVVHLIEAPLMIIDINVWQIIRKEEEGRFQKFVGFMNYAPDFANSLQGLGEKTLFVPSNEAIEAIGADKIRSLKTNTSAMTSLLLLHMVETSVSSYDVESKRISEYFSPDTKKKLYFSTIEDNIKRAFKVQAGGVIGQTIETDISATDGIIHIIDTVLGIPYLTVYETLRKPATELDETFQMSSQGDWNLPLMDINETYTFFAPSNAAWKKMEEDTPTPYKQLKMEPNQHYLNKILDRHLVVGKALNRDDLEHEKEDIQVANGKLKIEKSYEPDELYLVWEGMRAKIFRPEVQTTNGIIHIIDHVIFENKKVIEIEESGSPKPSGSTKPSKSGFIESSVIQLVIGVLLTVL